jgi:hypothetical protein
LSTGEELFTYFFAEGNAGVNGGEGKPRFDPGVADGTSFSRDKDENIPPFALTIKPLSAAFRGCCAMMLTLSPKRRFYSDIDCRLIKFYVHFLLSQVGTDVTIGAVKGQQRQDEYREGCLEFDVTVF